MTVNINDLNEAWISAGQTVADLQSKATAMINDDSATKEDVVAIKNEIENAKAKRDLAHATLIDARADEVDKMTDAEAKPLNENEQKIEDDFIKDFKGMMRNDPKVMNVLTSETDESGNAAGLTIPQDIQTAIHQLVRQYDSLEQYVNHEAVTTATGSRVYEKFSDITAMSNLDDESAEITALDDPKLTLIKYTIKRYAGISTVTNSLLKDSAENILQWLTGWIAKKVVVTRNKAIIEKLNAAPKKATLTKFDDIKDLVNKQLDPALLSTSIFITNQSGYAELAKVKDAQGNYLLQPVVSNPDIKQIDGKKVVVLADRWLSGPSTGLMPLYFGDPKQAITLFDREHMSLLTTNIGGGAFEHDQTKVRVIDRFDVVSTDSDAIVVGSFKAIANQESTATTGTMTNA